jgi:hypothetical protein
VPVDTRIDVRAGSIWQLTTAFSGKKNKDPALRRNYEQAVEPD